MSHKYTFCLLRYMPDPVTQEFANVGVVVSLPSERFLKARFSPHYGRISRMFGKISGAAFRSYVRFLQTEINTLGERSAAGFLFEDPISSLASKLTEILPKDDSAFQFSPAGTGVTLNPDEALDALYQRYIGQYDDLEAAARKDDDAVWRIFKAPLERKSLSVHFESKTIKSSDYEYEFEHSWKNGIWHLYEPLSLDLGDPGSILDKANRWLGRVTTLAESSDRFKLYFLLGKPKDDGLQQAYQKAKNILNRVPGQKELIGEDQIDSFVREVEREFDSHK